MVLDLAEESPKKGEENVETAPKTVRLPSPQKTDAFRSATDSTNRPPGQSAQPMNVTPTPTQGNPEIILQDLKNNKQSTLSPTQMKDNAQPFFRDQYFYSSY